MKMNRLNLMFLFLILGFASNNAYSQGGMTDKFRQIYTELPTPNTYRTGGGAPGHQYWQQKADYTMQIRLDDEKQRVYGEETISYTNNSPDQLEYLWLQMDQNQQSKTSDTYTTAPSNMKQGMSLNQIQDMEPWFDGGFKLDFVKDVSGKDIPYSVVKTMMRVDPPKPVKPGETYIFKIKWWYNINDRIRLGGRSGYEYFPKDNNYLYTIAQFFPRMCVYDDIEGWQNKQFLGAGEFTLAFGNYTVSLTVPSDHVVAATGVLTNPKEVLTKDQFTRFEKAKSERINPMAIVTETEARAAELTRAKTEKTWVFQANNVRDFAFASSRKFIWDAMGVAQKNGTVVMAMSAYPKEGNPLWSQYSTKAVAHTLKWYTHHTFDYPYPVAWSIHTNNIGMEYPMICFNGGRPDEDGTYSERVKYGMISVIIHEVGHNYFPMIVNSDERQWTWMDEGLNSFLQYLAEQQWERDYPSRRGPASNIVEYMNGDINQIRPIMTNSESVFQLGNNAYGKPATALNILRETVLGRELFDYAFKMYSTRWMFKHPAPADFFRTIEDASGIDLDWFWHGWFFTIDKVDIGLDKVSWYKIDSKNPEVELPYQKGLAESKRNISSLRNEKEILKTQDEIDLGLKDFYSTYNPFAVTPLSISERDKAMKNMSEAEKSVLSSNKNYYEITFSNKGGLVMPLILLFEYTDGTKEEFKVPAEIWRKDNFTVTKVFPAKGEVKQISLDPYFETADVDLSNNYYPEKPTPSRFELFKSRGLPAFPNPMRSARQQGGN